MPCEIRILYTCTSTIICMYVFISLPSRSRGYKIYHVHSSSTKQKKKKADPGEKENTQRGQKTKIGSASASIHFAASYDWIPECKFCTRTTALLDPYTQGEIIWIIFIFQNNIKSTICTPTYGIYKSTYFINKKTYPLALVILFTFYQA